MRGAFRHMNSQCKRERPGEIHKQIVAVYGNIMNQQNMTKWCCEFSEGRTDVHDDDEVQEEVTTWFKGQAADVYDAVIQKLVPRLNKCLDTAGNSVENESYIQAIHSQCHFCKLKMLYMFKTAVSLLSGHALYF
jgi:hypothetical protein